MSANCYRGISKAANLVISCKLELKFDGLFESFEPPSNVSLPEWRRVSSIPVPLLLFQRGDAQEFVYGPFRILALQLLRIVVFVFNVDITALLFVIVFVLEIITIACQNAVSMWNNGTYSSCSESCMKSSSSDIVAVWTADWDFWEFAVSNGAERVRWSNRGCE
jgi:hypothetical protein